MQHARDGIRIGGADRRHRLSNRRFDRSPAPTIQRATFLREIEMDAARVAFTALARHETGALEALDDPCDSAWVKVEQGGECAEHEAGVAPDEAQCEALWRSEADAPDHPF